MIDFTRALPVELRERRWLLTLCIGLAALAVALSFDRQLSLWAQDLPEPVLGAFAQLTRYGESDWILIPAAVFYLLTAAIALLTRWKLMRTVLWQFAALYAFIFVGVGLPGAVGALLKRAIGRGRPENFDATGLFGFQPNWLDWTYQSFPSGHATVAFALAGTLGFLSQRWFYPAMAIAAAIAFSRVSLGVHYPSDVLGGALLGLLGAYLTLRVFAARRWMFEGKGGLITVRPMSALRRYLILKRRGSARAPLPGRP